MRFNEQALLLHSKGDGPRVKVRRAKAVHFRSGQEEDVVEVLVTELNGERLDSFTMAYGHKIDLDLPHGHVQVLRVAGKGPVTVVLETE